MSRKNIAASTSVFTVISTSATVLLIMTGATGCGKGIVADQAQVNAAVDRIASGKLVHDIEKQQQDVASQISAKAATKSASTSVSSQASLDDVTSGASATAPATASPCDKLPNPAITAAQTELDAAMTQFGSCLRDLGKDTSTALQALEWFKIYNLPNGQRPLSTLTDDELKAFNKAHVGDFTEENPAIVIMLRSQLSDSDLDEVQALVARYKAALLAAEKNIFTVLDSRSALVSLYAEKLDRYKVLQTIRQLSDKDTTGEATAKAISDIISAENGAVPQDLANFPSNLLNPYAISSVIPDEGMELKPLTLSAENPFQSVLVPLGNLAGDPASDDKTRMVYKLLRDRDNPEFISHPSAESAAKAPEDVVHVAFIDSGIDWVTNPDLGLFLSNNRADEVSNGDFADGDLNPYVPSVSEWGHGSGTSATLLTIMSHYAPETLKSRSLDLAMWKVFGIREILSGGAGKEVSWSNRPSVPNAIVSNIESTGVKPKIVSVSMSFTLSNYLKRKKKEAVLKSAPWLWVMSAGNDAADLDTTAAGAGETTENGQILLPACFSDIAPENRVDSRILCVGAAISGIVNDKIAAYSNYGKRVDVYAYQSYIDICPNGTSCATPSVAGAAAAIAAKYPKLTPEQIKEVIVAAAEERTLAIGTEDEFEHKLKLPNPKTAPSPVQAPNTPVPANLSQDLLGLNSIGFKFADAQDPSQELPVSPIEQAPAKPTQLTVKVFDPITMLAKALQIAAQK